MCARPHGYHAAAYGTADHRRREAVEQPRGAAVRDQPSAVGHGPRALPEPPQRAARHDRSTSWPAASSPPAAWRRVHINGSVVTVTLGGGRTGAGLGDIVRNLFLHYGDRRPPPARRRVRHRAEDLADPRRLPPSPRDPAAEPAEDARGG